MSGDDDRLWTGSMPEIYHRLLGPPVFQPFATDLARRAAALGPKRVLELAAGTGIATSALVAAAPAAEITATDLNLAMVEFGANRVPEASWRRADADRLPFDDARFDLVLCQFGAMFFLDKAAAFAEARRVLAPGGRMLFNVWGTVDEHGWARALVNALARAIPHDPPTFIACVPHDYHDTVGIAADLVAGGLRPVSIDTVTLEGHADRVADVATGFCTGTPLRPDIAARADLAATTEMVIEEMTARLGRGPVTVPMTAHVVVADR